MPSELPRLDDLVDAVERAQADALGRLGSAVELAQSLDVLGDNLIGHFVDASRAEGESWSSIGAILGVSKQAAQQRFVPRGASTIEAVLESAAVSGYTGRALHVLRQSAHHARRRNHAVIGTEHMLLGLLDEPEGLACRTLDTLGATPIEIRQKLKKHFGVGDADAPPVLSGRAEKAIDLTRREALRLGHNYVGTEHQLLGLLAEAESVASDVLQAVGVTHESASNQIVRLLAAHQRRQRDGASQTSKPDRDLGVVIVEADAFSKAQVASDALRSGHAVLLDLRLADTLLRRRAIDLVSGAAYALGAKVEKVGDDGVTVVPEGTSIAERRAAIEAYLTV
ncbi:MAG: cell division protein SepF [Acidimicrobiales bacterium]